MIITDVLIVWHFKILICCLAVTSGPSQRFQTCLDSTAWTWLESWRAALACISNLNWEYLIINLWPRCWNVCISMPRSCFCSLHRVEVGDKYVWFHIFIKLSWEKCCRTWRIHTKTNTNTMRTERKLHKNVLKSYFSQLLQPPAQISQIF